MLRLATMGLVVALMTLTSGCVVEHDRGYHQGYREGYYDHERHRYWHDRAWNDCVEHDVHCH